MPKTIRVPNTSSSKTGSGATEGVLDQGVRGCPDYLIWAGLMGREDTRQKAFPVSGWDSPLRGWQAWRPDVQFPFSINRLCTTLGPSGVYINWRVQSIEVKTNHTGQTSRVQPLRSRGRSTLVNPILIKVNQAGSRVLPLLRGPEPG